jgi:hypothetical protein
MARKEFKNDLLNRLLAQSILCTVMGSDSVIVGVNASTPKGDVPIQAAA